MLTVKYTTQFKRDLKLMKKRNKNLKKLEQVMKKIADEEILPEKLKDHLLSSNWKGYRELHVEPDWLLIYKFDSEAVIFVRIGTHSDLF